MPKQKSPSQSAKNICLATGDSAKQTQVQMNNVKRAVHRSIVLTMVSSITFILSIAIVIGMIGAAGKIALFGTVLLLIASIAAALEARALFHTIAEERRVDHLKSEFISLASHQLRTPLSSLQWYAELLNEEKKLTKQQKEYAKEMLFAVRRMNNLIDSLLHAARLECEEIVPRKRAVEINTMIKDLTKELKLSAQEKDITISANIPKNKVILNTDAVLLNVVLQNLCSNAVKYTKIGGAVEVHIETEDTFAIISIHDNGIGIPKKDISRIFQRLFRASNVLKMDTDGNGLGLYITKMVLDSLGGKITVESTEGKGSVFIVKMPLKKRKAASGKRKKKRG